MARRWGRGEGAALKCGTSHCCAGIPEVFGRCSGYTRGTTDIVRGNTAQGQRVRGSVVRSLWALLAGLCPYLGVKVGE